MTGKHEILGAGKDMQAAGDCWEQAAGLFGRAYRAQDPGKALGEAAVWVSLYGLSMDRLRMAGFRLR